MDKGLQSVFIWGAALLVVVLAFSIAFNTTTIGLTSFTVEEDDVLLTTAVEGFDFQTALDVTHNPAGEVNVSFDSVEVGTTTWGSGAAITWTMDGATEITTSGANDLTLNPAGDLLLKDDMVVEADLMVVDAPADEECLTYEAAVGDFEWQACGAGVAQNLFETIDAPAGTDPVADNANDTLQLLTSSGAITVTGAAAGDSLDFDIADNNLLEIHLKAVDAAADEECLTYEAAVGDFEWQPCAAGAGHVILDGATHTDSVADGVTRGSLIYGNVTPKWDELVIGAADTYLRSNNIDASWSTITLGTDTAGNYAVGDAEGGNATGLVCVDCVDGTDLADTITLDATTQVDTGAFGWIFQVNNPASAGVDINGIGAFADDLLHVHQHTGNPTGGNALHVEATDPDVNPIVHFGSLDVDFTAELVSVLINAVDNDDTDWIPLRIQDDSGGTPDTIFEIGWDGSVTAINVTSGADPGHTHTTTSVSGLDMSADTNLTAGRSLTLTDDDVFADAELYTDTKCIWFEDPVATDDFNSIWRNSTANSLTLTELWAESDQTVTFMLQVDDGTPADIDTVDLAPAAGEAEDVALDGDTTLAASEELDLAITSVAGAPTWVSICWTFTWDD